MCIAFLDVTLQRPLEPHAPSASAEQIDELIGALADAGAGNIRPTPLYLMRVVKDLFFVWLRHQHPELLSTYAGLYAHGSRTPVITAASSGHG